MTIWHINQLSKFTLQEIFLMLPKDHAAIARVCRHWRECQEANMRIILGSYQGTPSISQLFPPRIQALNALEILYPQCVEIVSQALRTIKANDAEEILKSYSLSYPLDAHSLALLIQKISDIGLIKIFLCRGKIIPKSEHPPEINQEATFIRRWITQNQDSLNKITELSIRWVNLNWLPPEIGCLEKLKIIVFSNNALHFLPSEIGSFQELTSLDLSNNNLSFLPSEFKSLQKLQALSLDQNHFAVLPPEICNLRNLEVLHYRNNGLTVLPPEIGNLTTLKRFFLYKNLLRDLPPQITNCVQLEELQLCFNWLGPKESSLRAIFEEKLPHCRLSF
jgi:hypothetical protein